MKKTATRTRLWVIIATMHQIEKKSTGAIRKCLGVSRKTIFKWRAINLGDPNSTRDSKRNGRPLKLANKQTSRFKKMVEKGGHGNISRVAATFSMTTPTVRNTITRLGGEMINVRAEIPLTDSTRAKRLTFALGRLKESFKQWCWFDDKSLEIPPPPPTSHNSPVYRFTDSTSQVPVYEKRKTPIKIMMFVGVCYNGKSKPVFNVVKRIGPRGGITWETTSVVVDVTLQRLSAVVFPFMKKHGARVLALDNAPVQAHRRVLEAIEAERGITSAGFQSDKLKATLRSPIGIPPNSPDLSILDAGVFGFFELKYREANPKTIEEAIAVATKIWREMDIKLVRRCIDGFPARLQEIVNNEGGGSHWQRGTNAQRLED